MMLFLLLRLASLILVILLVVRIWRASALHAILSLFIPFYVLVPLIKYWKDPDHDIKWLVAPLFVCAVASVWMLSRMAHEYQAEQAALQAQLIAEDDAGDVDEDAEANGGDFTKPSTSVPSAEIEIGPAAMVSGHRQPVYASAAARNAVTASAATREHPVAVAPVQTSAWTRSVESTPEVPLTFARASSEATVFRGRFERASMGLTLDLPDHFRALSSVDARRIATSLGQPDDTREIAWVLHEDVSFSGASSWHVRVRWLSDGWVAPSLTRDAEHLLRVAQQSGAATRRLAGSGGELLGYAVAPSFDAGLADWVEERLPDAAALSVLDCHAVRLGRNGVLEFSVVGAPAGSQALCAASVRLLARRAQVDHGAQYQAQAPADVVHAAYTLEDLVTQRH
jgi:hypothetical protein